MHWYFLKLRTYCKLIKTLVSVRRFLFIRLKSIVKYWSRALNIVGVPGDINNSLMDLPGILEVTIVSLACSVVATTYLLCRRNKSTSYRLLLYLSVCGMRLWDLIVHAYSYWFSRADALSSLFFVLCAEIVPSSITCPSLVVLYNIFLRCELNRCELNRAIHWHWICIFTNAAATWTCVIGMFM